MTESRSTRQPVVYVQMVPAPPTNAIAIASLVLGIVACLLSLIPLLGVVLFPLPALLAFIFGIVGIVQGNKLGGLRLPQAVTGLILSIAPIALTLVSYAIYVGTR